MSKIGTSHRRYSSVKDAATYAAASTDTIRRWIAAGNLTPFRNGKFLRVDLNEIDAMLTPSWTGAGK